MKHSELLSTMDATKWADEFIKVITDQPVILKDFVDKGFMIAWFSNAIMTGYDMGRRAEEKRWIDNNKTPCVATEGCSESTQ